MQVVLRVYALQVACACGSALADPRARAYNNAGVVTLWPCRMLSAACESSISVSSLCLHVCLSLFRLCFFSHLFCFGVFLERLATTVYHAVSMHDFARYYPCAPRAASTYILHSAALAISLRDLLSGC